MSIPGIGIGYKMQLDILNRTDKSIQTFFGIVQQGVSRNHQLPFGVPHGASYEAIVGVLR